MAGYLKGFSRDEAVALTHAMVELGRAARPLEAVRADRDKHSTGGVGDGTTLVVAPLAAELGMQVVKLSGHGLGHTGGTLDKLDAIPGMRTELSGEELIDQVEAIGLAVCAQTADLVPADKAMYGLRDVTATVDNIALIASSVMSKKLAGGAEAILLDVKTGSGAFMESHEAALRARGAVRGARRRGGPGHRGAHHRHGPAAGRSGRQRERGARGDRRAAGRALGPLHRPVHRPGRPHGRAGRSGRRPRRGGRAGPQGAGERVGARALPRVSWKPRGRPAHRRRPVAVAPAAGAPRGAGRARGLARVSRRRGGRPRRRQARRGPAAQGRRNRPGGRHRRARADRRRGRMATRWWPRCSPTTTTRPRRPSASCARR